MTALWIKSFHIIAVVTWFAALFYLPRLFVYHAMTEDEPGRERFRVMERKLYRGIMNPSAVVAVGLGVALIVVQPFWLEQGWLHVKILLVVGLIGYHLYCGRLLRAFAEDRNTRSHRWYRVFNELPVLVLIAVVLLVELKPWA
ncbi:protoporphyrinogen oxidase HemJ [Spiribacter aquaticus]|jgi:putative membrane protein|uniref:Protoporphyrinogen IX oxidase n=2 Tax=Spiribacter TaxID=1335745 RepID=A0A557RM34_9GAMM|nr:MULTISPECIES: protoporphyrinogen oxidase HemJ [Spiribacter]AUB79010.1 TIGR00701 family protein [Spiribacter roseus]KAF0279195.1 TIGR00701 family protein [Spiribacter roseus]KAF0281666.1 TIGR00701 family protein [Spiribacter roseus]TVO66158.1 protoporphyrinogen oxidase HemJ [Spiribacter aquaticus]